MFIAGAIGLLHGPGTMNTVQVIGKIEEMAGCGLAVVGTNLLANLFKDILLFPE